MKFWGIFLVFVTITPADPLASCRDLERHGKRSESRACFQKFTGDRNPANRAEAFWGLGDTASAAKQFEIALKQQPGDADVRVRFGRLLFEGLNSADAEKLFDEALKLDPKNANALLGMAILASEGFDQKAVELAEQALALDPNLLEAQELLAKLALEDSNEAKAIVEAEKALKMSPAALDAMAVRMTVDFLNNKTSSEWESKIKGVNPTYAPAWAFAGHILVLNRRYEEGIAHYQTALKLDPTLQ
ncbi:MAG TPA: tetratricopeptide repeat protein, partial [Bryobacteraceae bacterium]|nr:tetratricopeptide repeat protein [Bryobacteraceae bacterium]